MPYPLNIALKFPWKKSSQFKVKIQLAHKRKFPESYIILTLNSNAMLFWQVLKWNQPLPRLSNCWQISWQAELAVFNHKNLNLLQLQIPELSPVVELASDISLQSRPDKQGALQIPYSMRFFVKSLYYCYHLNQDQINVSGAKSSLQSWVYLKFTQDAL